MPIRANPLAPRRQARILLGASRARHEHRNDIEAPGQGAMT
ncbi:hypothetical protein BGLA2_430004 [Burkholderia gladioli]|nr:hypothetical protein BGLA2_430004 [Burkholderia gladioli]